MFEAERTMFYIAMLVEDFRKLHLGLCQILWMHEFENIVPFELIVFISQHVGCSRVFPDQCSICCQERDIVHAVFDHRAEAQFAGS